MRSLTVPAAGLLVSFLASLPEVAAGELRHRSWQTRDGLPHNSVTAVAQDETGYLWIATVEGLVRFDGLVFTVFDTSTHPELQSNFINALLPTPDGALWVGTRKGLARFEGGRFELFSTSDGLAGDVIEDLALDRRGTLWIGTRSGLSRYGGGRFQTFRSADGLAGDTVFSLAVDDRSNLWIGSLEGLSRYAEGRFLHLEAEEGLGDDFVVSLHADADHGLWVGTVDSGLHRLDTRRLEAEPVLAEDPPRLVFSLLRDSRRALWIGTRSGLERLADGVLGTVPELADDMILTLLEDRDGRIWAGTLQSGLHALEEPAGESAAGSEQRPPQVVLEGLSVQQQSFLPGRPPELPTGPLDLEFRYAAIDFADPGDIHFRHLLEGYDDHWIDAGKERYASYTNIPPGSYRFRVRAVGSAAAHSTEISYQLLVPAPFYRTAVFYLLAALALLGAIYALFLLRVRRLLKTRQTLQQRIEDQTREILDQKEQLAQYHLRLDRAHGLLRRTNEELKSHNREKSDFLAIATHDLRVPLINLRGFAGELRYCCGESRRILAPQACALAAGSQAPLRQVLEQDLPQALSAIEAASQRMEGLIDPILKLSRLARRPLKIQPVSLADPLREALVSLEERLVARRTRVEVGPMPEVLADANALEEIFQQLLSLALESIAAEGPGRIEVRAKSEGRETVISVHDDGRAGGAASGSDEAAASAPGSGDEMGLSFARVLVRRHGGRLWQGRRFSLGNSFYFSIPRKFDPTRLEI